MSLLQAGITGSDFISGSPHCLRIISEKLDVFVLYVGRENFRRFFVNVRDKYLLTYLHHDVIMDKQV
jgi:hypothetical protein